MLKCKGKCHNMSMYQWMHESCCRLFPLGTFYSFSLQEECSSPSLNAERRFRLTSCCATLIFDGAGKLTSPTPTLPLHPSGAVVCLSLGSHVIQPQWPLPLPLMEVMPSLLARRVFPTLTTHMQVGWPCLSSPPSHHFLLSFKCFMQQPFMFSPDYVAMHQEV